MRKFNKTKLLNVLSLTGIYLFFIFTASIVFLILINSLFLGSIKGLFFRPLFILLFIVFIFSSIMFSFVWFKVKWVLVLTFRDIIIISLLIFFSNINIYLLVPFNVSRSNSMIIMGYLYENHSVAKSRKDIEQYVINKYFYEYGAVRIRLDEQINAGNVEESDNGIILTDRGNKVVELLNYISNLYNIDNNFLESNNITK